MGSEMCIRDSSSSQTVAGIDITDEDGNVLWAAGSTLIGGGSTHSDFDFSSGLFAQSLTIDVDLTGLGSGSDNIAIDNVHFGQIAVPEPSSAIVCLAGSVLVMCRRRRGYLDSTA